MNTLIYKITKIVRMLWLAERSVCMKECKHGCGVKMFCFSLSKLSHKHKFEKVFEFKTRQVYFICRCLRWLKLVTLCVNFFRLSWHFKREKSVFWKRQVQKSDQINLDGQSGSDQLGSTRTNSDRIKK